jgi:hypothetical protein
LEQINDLEFESNTSNCLFFTGTKLLIYKIFIT